MNVLDFLEDYLYIGLFGYILVEEIGVPMPIAGDVLLIFLGVMSLEGQANFFVVLLITCAATFIGSSLLYYVSRTVGRRLLIKYERYLKYLHITPSRVDSMEHYMLHYGYWVLIVARLTPGLRVLGTIAAGLLGVPYRVFISATMMATVAWVSAYFWLGVFLGRRFAEEINLLFSNKWFLVLFFLAGLLVWAVLYLVVSPAIKRVRHNHPPID